MDFAFHALADSEWLLFGMPIGKMVTGVAVGQAICPGKLTWESKAGVSAAWLPDLDGKHYGTRHGMGHWMGRQAHWLELRQ